MLSYKYSSGIYTCNYKQYKNDEIFLFNLCPQRKFEELDKKEIICWTQTTGIFIKEKLCMNNTLSLLKILSLEVLTIVLAYFLF